MQYDLCRHLASFFKISHSLTISCHYWSYVSGIPRNVSQGDLKCMVIVMVDVLMGFTSSWRMQDLLELVLDGNNFFASMLASFCRINGPLSMQNASYISADHYNATICYELGYTIEWIELRTLIKRVNNYHK